MRYVERYFWVVCLGATALGLFVPAAGEPLRPLLKIFLAGILFFTGLKTDFRKAAGCFKRPVLLGYVAAMLLAVLPLSIYGLARLVLPAEQAAGVLIVAAMPAGMACSSLTDIVGGNSALALVVTLVTSLACPVVSPWVIEVGTGATAGDGWGFLGRQALFLALILFTPTVAAYLCRRGFPRFVARHRDSYTGLSMLSLALLILSAMSDSSADFQALLRERPGEAALLAGFMLGFSGLLHLAGWFLAPRRPIRDRAALSLNAAYVNNGLAIVFALKFFKPRFGAAAVLPAILLEVPMILAILPLRAYVARKVGRPTSFTGGDTEQAAETPCPGDSPAA